MTRYALPLALILAACAGETTGDQMPSSSSRAAAATTPTPPAAEKRPVEITQHGVSRTDEYAWLRDADWQEVLRDPSKLDADIRAYLEAEVAYYEAMTDHLAPLRERLVAEMRGRIKEDESSVPMPDGPYEYAVRFREGGEYPVYYRVAPNGEEEILFDGDAEGEGADFFDIGGVDASNDHTMIAYGVDRLGSEYYDIRIRDIATGEEREETIPSTDGEAIWAADDSGFFYVERDDNQRPKRVKYHALGTEPAEDRLVYEEEDDTFFLGIDETTSRKYLVIGTGNSESSEDRVVPLDAPDAEPRVIAPRRPDELYDVDHREDTFYIHTNADGATDFKVVTAPEDAPGRENWSDWLAHRPGTYVTGVETYKDWIVRTERADGRPRIVVSDAEGTSHEIAFDQDAYALSLGGWGEYDTDTIRFAYESPSQPSQVFDYDMRTRERTLRKTQEVPSGHDPDRYVVEALTAVAEDGAEIPVTLLRLKDAPEGAGPLMLYGYGSYGAYMSDGFSTGVLSLVDRGMPFALAHIRGGSAKGRQWYLDGKLSKKANTFTDFNAAAHMLIEEGYTKDGEIAAYGGSAGGLLVGAAVNLEPDLYGAILGAVPFVDVVSTISDAELPLTPPEWDEWGNPIRSAEDYRTIAAYSPYDNVRADAGYPPILATGGLTDYRVTYWEPAKWIARLRDRDPEGGPFLLRMNMSAGHGGSAARFERMEERAHLYAFALDQLGLREAEPAAGGAE